MNLLKNKTLIISGLVVILLTGFFLLNNSPKDKSSKSQPSEESLNRFNGKNNRELGSARGNCLADDCLAVSNLDYPVSELPLKSVDALKKALDDEYKAYSTYDAVIEKFGSVRPFIMIIRAEEQHISSLKSIFDKYGITIPDNPYSGKLEVPESIRAACSIGIQAEIDNAALYKDELLPAVVDYEDITRVFTNLMNASQEKHLPAFERCSN